MKNKTLALWILAMALAVSLAGCSKGDSKAGQSVNEGDYSGTPGGASQQK
ncbi:MAG: hypothetical protein JNM85_09450 [Chthonomonas sp.]|nr:hypothetical protein [Chthonomonas sp.]